MTKTTQSPEDYTEDMLIAELAHQGVKVVKETDLFPYLIEKANDHRMSDVGAQSAFLIVRDDVALGKVTDYGK